MSNLKHLTDKIIQDAEEKAKQIIEEAKQEEKKLMDKNQQEVEKTTKEILEKAEEESKNKRERILSRAELEVRNSKLGAKQQVIQQAFEKAIEALSKMPKETFLQWVKEAILELPIKGDEEIILSVNQKEILTPAFIDALNEALINKNKKGEITISSETRDMKGGFILAKNGIEINYTFEALVFSMREELEHQVAQLLFQ